MNFWGSFCYIIILSWVNSCVSENLKGGFPISSSCAFAEARCAAGCLNHYGSKSTGNNNHNNTSVLRCSTGNLHCKMCREVCSNKLVSDLRCDQICGLVDSIHYDVCYGSCKFINEVIDAGLKSGSCPEKPSSVVAFTDVMKLCANDWECMVDEKCCTYKQNKYQCESATFDGKQRDKILITVSELKSTSCKLSWKWKENQSIKGGVQYVIEKRHSMHKPASEEEFSFWEYAGQTSSFHRTFTDLNINTYYQFRIAAVNETGYHGYSMTSVAKLPMNFHRPSPPTDLHIRNRTTTIKDGTVGVVLSWKRPNVTVGKILKYKVEFSKTLPRYNYTAFTIVNKINIPATRKTMNLQHLESDTSYTAVICAVVAIGNVNVESKRQTLVFTTYPVHRKNYGARSKTIEELATIPPTVSRLITRGKHTEMSAYITRIVKSGSFVDVHIEWERFLDININTVKVSWQGSHCRDNDFPPATNTDNLPSSAVTSKVHFTFVRSEVLKYTLSGLKRYCQYHIELEPYYHYGAKANRIVFQLDTAFDGFLEDAEDDIEGSRSVASRLLLPCRMSSIVFVVFLVPMVV